MVPKITSEECILYSKKTYSRNTVERTRREDTSISNRQAHAESTDLREDKKRRRDTLNWPATADRCGRNAARRKAAQGQKSGEDSSTRESPQARPRGHPGKTDSRDRSNMFKPSRGRRMKEDTRKNQMRSDGRRPLTQPSRSKSRGRPDILARP